MRKLLTILVIFLLPMSIFGQEKNQQKPLPIVKYDDNVNLPLTDKERAQILEVFGDSAERLVFNNSNRLKSIKNILRNRVVIDEYPNKDLSYQMNISDIALTPEARNEAKSGSLNRDNFNPLKYNFNFDSTDGIKHFRIDNTQYLITIMPQHAN